MLTLFDVSEASVGSDKLQDPENSDWVEKLAQLRWHLVASLRANAPLDKGALSVHLRNTVAHRLQIDQPKYSALS